MLFLLRNKFSAITIMELIERESIGNWFALHSECAHIRQSMVKRVRYSISVHLPLNLQKCIRIAIIIRMDWLWCCEMLIMIDAIDSFEKLLLNDRYLRTYLGQEFPSNCILRAAQTFTFLIQSNAPYSVSREQMDEIIVQFSYLNQFH